jgi:hypothetical protein
MASSRRLRGRRPAWLGPSISHVWLARFTSPSRGLSHGLDLSQQFGDEVPIHQS